MNQGFVWNCFREKNQRQTCSRPHPPPPPPPIVAVPAPYFINFFALDSRFFVSDQEDTWQADVIFCLFIGCMVVWVQEGGFKDSKGRDGASIMRMGQSSYRWKRSGQGFEPVHLKPPPQARVSHWKEGVYLSLRRFKINHMKELRMCAYTWDC